MPLRLSRVVQLSAIHINHASQLPFLNGFLPMQLYGPPAPTPPESSSSEPSDMAPAAVSSSYCLAPSEQTARARGQLSRASLGSLAMERYGGERGGLSHGVPGVPGAAATAATAGVRAQSSQYLLASSERP